MSEQFNPNEWVTTTEAMKLTGYTRNAFINAKKRGKLKGTKRGNMYFFRRIDILEYMRRMKSLGAQKFTPTQYREPECND